MPLKRSQIRKPGRWGELKTSSSPMAQFHATELCWAGFLAKSRSNSFDVCCVTYRHRDLRIGNAAKVAQQKAKGPNCMRYKKRTIDLKPGGSQRLAALRGFIECKGSRHVWACGHVKGTTTAKPDHWGNTSTSDRTQTRR